MNIDLDILASEIARRIAPPIPIEHQIWSAAQVAEYLGTSLSNFQQFVAPHPDFPRPIRVPNTKGQRLHARWFARDVIDYMDDCKDR